MNKQDATPPLSALNSDMYPARFSSLLGATVECGKLLCVFMHMCLQLPACVQAQDLSTHPHTVGTPEREAKQTGGVSVLISDRAATATIKPQLSGSAGEAKALDWGRDTPFTSAPPPLQKNIHTYNYS